MANTRKWPRVQRIRWPSAFLTFHLKSFLWPDLRSQLKSLVLREVFPVSQVKSSSRGYDLMLASAVPLYKCNGKGVSCGDPMRGQGKHLLLILLRFWLWSCDLVGKSYAPHCSLLTIWRLLSCSQVAENVFL